MFIQAFGTAAEALEHFLARGVINWGTPVSSIFEDGQLYIQQARATEASGEKICIFVVSITDVFLQNVLTLMFLLPILLYAGYCVKLKIIINKHIILPGLVSVLLEGPPNSGKTALAAQLAKMSDFPFVKVCSPEDMVGFTESAKCLQIRKVCLCCVFYVKRFFFVKSILKVKGLVGFTNSAKLT